MFTYDDEWDFYELLFQCQDENDPEQDDEDDFYNHPSLSPAERNPSLR